MYWKVNSFLPPKRLTNRFVNLHKNNKEIGTFSCLTWEISQNENSVVLLNKEVFINKEGRNTFLQLKGSNEKFVIDEM